MGNSGSLSKILTQRELEVLRLVAMGLSNRDIAEELVVVPDTVRWYTKQIYSKLAVSGRVQAINRARDLGLLQDESDPQQPDSPAKRAAPKHNLPESLTTFIGRSREMAEVERWP
jgi:DNA-binding CsgD family transcriptional regulator